MSTLFGLTLTLFFVIDALGNLPTYLSLLRPHKRSEQRKIAFRELLLALGIMASFHYLGQILLTMLEIPKQTVQISGGLILFLIAIRLIFSNDEEPPQWESQKLLFFPIATPLIAGPSVLTMIMIIAQEQPSDLLVLGAIFLAWLFSALIFVFARPIHKLIREKGLVACQRLMGLIVAMVAVQMFIEGIGGFLNR